PAPALAPWDPAQPVANLIRPLAGRIQPRRPAAAPAARPSTGQPRHSGAQGIRRGWQAGTRTWGRLTTDDFKTARIVPEARPLRAPPLQSVENRIEMSMTHYVRLSGRAKAR